MFEVILNVQGHFILSFNIKIFFSWYIVNMSEQIKIENTIENSLNKAYQNYLRLQPIKPLQPLQPLQPPSKQNVFRFGKYKGHNI